MTLRRAQTLEVVPDHTEQQLKPLFKFLVQTQDHKKNNPHLIRVYKAYKDSDGSCCKPAYEKI